MPSPQAALTARAGVQDTAPFRQARLRMSAVIQNVSLVLCNDQPQTFGAPDVLQLSAADVAVQFAQHTQFPDRPPSQVRAGVSRFRVWLLGVGCLGSQSLVWAYG